MHCESKVKLANIGNSLSGPSATTVDNLICEYKLLWTMVFCIHVVTARTVSTFNQGWGNL